MMVDYFRGRLSMLDIRIGSVLAIILVMVIKIMLALTLE
jgi:hypothetical protein